jgi:tetratricopeptide (TPR) repeat protein
VLPIFARHGYRMMPELPPPLLDAFAEGAWEALDDTPRLARLEQLIALGRLEARRQDHDKARRALEMALAEPAEPLSRAESHYLLADVLRQAGQTDEARRHFELAAEHPDFESAALVGLAIIADETGRGDEAITLLRRLRWRDPENLEVMLRFADAARRVEDWPSALEALNWARVKHPDDPRPWSALLETHLAMDDVAAATSLLRELRLDPPPGIDFDRLESLIDGASTRREQGADDDM